MFNFATYNGVPILTYGLVGITTSILALITFNPSILELKEGDEKSSIGSIIGLDELKMPEMTMPEMSSSIDTSYLPGINMLAQPFSTTGDDTTTVEPLPSATESTNNEEEEASEEDEANVEEEASDDATTGGKKQNKTKNQRKLKKRKTKRRN